MPTLILLLGLLRLVLPGAGPQWAAITNTAAGGGTSNVVGRVYVPPAAETLIYDADGNLTQDVRWTYAWDAENRLVRLETAPAAVSNGVPRLGWTSATTGRAGCSARRCGVPLQPRRPARAGKRLEA